MEMTKNLKSILLIDDDKATNILHKYIIKKTNEHIFTHIASDAQQGLDYLLRKDEFDNDTLFPLPDIIFLDINMPVMDGWEFMEEYNNLQDSQKAHTLIMLLTTSINPSEKKRATETAGISGFMNKPLSVVKFQEIMNAHFYGSQSYHFLNLKT
jgi:CheY-like chemotaxis protein